MKVLFLDIDGVLNSEKTKERIRIKGYYGLCGVDPVLRDRYLNWLKGKDITVVLSSMWRYHPEMMGHLEENGIFWSDTTPETSALCWQVSTVTRGDEVKAWLEGVPTVTHYAILDDNDWFRGDQRPHFVQTDYEVGLQDYDLRRLEEILNV